MNVILKGSIYIILFIIFLGLIITGMKEQTLDYLLRMFAGLTGLIVLLWIFNRNHK